MKSLFHLWPLLTVSLFISTCSEDNPLPAENDLPSIESFTFRSNNTDHQAKIRLPLSYETDNNLPVIYLMDTTEPPLFEQGLDEFEKLTSAVNAISDFDAIIVSLADIIEKDYTTYDSTTYYYALFNDLAEYVDGNFEVGSSKTLIGRGNAGGMIFLGLFQESSASHRFTNFVTVDIPGSAINLANQMIINENFPIDDKENMKLHYSFAGEHQTDQNRALVDRLHNKDYPWLSFDSAEYPSLTHETIYPQAYKDGLAFLFEE